MTDNDRLLVGTFLASRDEIAFRQLYTRHTPGLYRFAMRLCGGSVPDAEEIIQDTWVSAAGALERFRWESSLRTWLSGIALNCYRQHIRSQKHEANSEELGDREARESTISGGERMDLEHALARLAERYRMVLVLHDVEGYTHEEIAQMLGIDAGTSKSQLFRARRRIREFLEPPAGSKETQHG